VGLVLDEGALEQIALTELQTPSVNINISVLHNHSLISQQRYQCLATVKVVKQTIKDHVSN
jgi:hypothetical protein